MLVPYFLELEDLILVLKEQECEPLGCARSIHSVAKSLKSTGQLSHVTKISHNLKTHQKLTSYVVAFLAKTYLSQVKEEDLLVPAQVFGSSSLDLLAICSLDGLSWKTCQDSKRRVLGEFLEKWPRSGMTRSGIAYQRQPLVPLTREI